jgi:hypothetical protein
MRVGIKANPLNASGTHIQDQTDALATLGFASDGTGQPFVQLKSMRPAKTETSPISEVPSTLMAGYMHKGPGGRNGLAGTAFFCFDDLANPDAQPI